MRIDLARLTACATLLGLLAVAPCSVPDAAAESCEYWVAPAPAGNDGNPGTFTRPWASLAHAAAQVLGQGGTGCTVWFKDGLYRGHSDLHERFQAPTTFKALNPYKAILENDGPVVELSGARNLILEGFEIRHAGPGAGGLVIYMSRADDAWTENITLRNNIFHDSYNNDLLKIHNGARFVTVEGNIFYNQGPGEEHIDVNGVDDVVIQDNIFFNDFSGSGRSDGDDVHSFITIKDSTGNPTGLTGSRRITVRRNVFLNWQGRRDTFVQIGNDGKPYHEAVDIRLENNLLIGNSPTAVYASLGLRGVRDVVFANNTVVGDLPSSSFGPWIDVKGQNPPNQNLFLVNNIWSDPTGSMGSDGHGSANEFSNGDPGATDNFALDSNLYWNGGAPIPSGEVASPLVHDARRVVADPLIDADQSSVVLPRWTGSAFASGSATVRQEFVRLVQRYGAIPGTSPAVGAADPALAPADDILGRPRFGLPDIGAYEFQPPPSERPFYMPLVSRT